MDGSRLALHVIATVGDDVVDATLESESGRVYAVTGGIPRFLTAVDAGQLQTMQAFAHKWKQTSSYRWIRQAGDEGQYAAWLSQKYGFVSAEGWCRHFEGKRFLDLGCGAGMASYFWLTSGSWRSTSPWIGVDISEAIDVAREQLGRIPNTHFVQADALKLPFADESFDAILSEGVLHHTPSTREALSSATRVLAAGGEINFYVYRRKSPAREFVDDYVRQRLRDLSDDDAWNEMRSFTSLARSLANLKTDVVIEEDVPLLGIKAGRQDVQRLIYWNFAKLYWNDAFDFEENVHINYDWYRPTYSHRQSADEVEAWCADLGLEIQRLHEQESGYTVRAIKRRNQPAVSS